MQLRYKVEILPMIDQTNAHFKAVIKPRPKIFKNSDNAYEYYRKCRALAEKGQFIVTLTEYTTK